MNIFYGEISKQMYVWFHVECLVFNLNPTFNTVAICQYISMRTDERTDRYDEANGRLSRCSGKIIETH